MYRGVSKGLGLSRWQRNRRLRQAVENHMLDIETFTEHSSLMVVSSQPDFNALNGSQDRPSSSFEQENVVVVESEEQEDNSTDTGSDWRREDESDESSSSESGSDIETEGLVDMKNFILDWANRFNITQTALSHLLKGLQPYHPELPLDARTLRQTPNIVVKSMNAGEYYNFGLLSGILQHINALTGTPAPNVHLNFNIDGLPLFKSSNTQLWPILCSINEDHTQSPFPVAMYCGPTKPPLEKFLEDFVPELKTLLEHGFIHQNTHFNVMVRAFICDTPAKAFIKCTKGHTGYFGCDKCCTEGTYVDHRVTFPELNAELRSDISFANRVDVGHHNSISPLTEIGVGMVSTFPLDYMHLACLGVTRRLLMAWKSGSRSHRLMATSVLRISGYLTEAKKYWPFEFSRKPRPLSELDRWKATEFRQFLLYLGPIVLKDVLTKPQYCNFLLFSVAISILIDPHLNCELNTYADTLLQTFVAHLPTLYGAKFVSYNVHALIHLSADVLRLGPLDTFSAFPYENYLQSLKRLVQTSHKPLQQICRRLKERTGGIVAKPSMQLGYSLVPSSFQKGQGEAGNSHYTKLMGPSFRLSTENLSDNTVYLNNGDIVRVKYFVKSGASISFMAQKYKNCNPFFEYPRSSSFLSIYTVANLSKTPRSYPVASIRQKVVCLPYKDRFVCLPLRHLQ
jgi:hypothetical protein